MGKDDGSTFFKTMAQCLLAGQLRTKSCKVFGKFFKNTYNYNIFTCSNSSCAFVIGVIKIHVRNADIYETSRTERINYICKPSKKGKRKIQGVPQSQTAALPRPQKEEETDQSEHAQIEQTYVKHKD